MRLHRYLTLLLIVGLLGGGAAAPSASAEVVSSDLTGVARLVGTGTVASSVRLPAAVGNYLQDLTVELEHDAAFAAVALVGRDGRPGSAEAWAPSAVGWLTVDGDVVCERTPDCNRTSIEGLHTMDNLPSTTLPAGEYQLLVVTEPPTSFELALTTPGTGDTTLTGETPDNVQSALMTDDDVLDSDHLWWLGEEREVRGSALTFFAAGVAGELNGPGEFNYCLYAGEPVPSQAGVAAVSYAPPCAGGVVVGVRAINLQQNYSALLTARGGVADGGIVGQGAHLVGLDDVTGYVAGGLWIGLPSD